MSTNKNTNKEITNRELLQKISSLIEKSDKKTDRKIAVLAKSTDSKIEALAKSVAVGFAGVDKRFEQMDKKIDDVEKRLSQKISGLNNRIDDLALNRATKDEQYLLIKRVEKIEQHIGLAVKGNTDSRYGKF